MGSSSRTEREFTSWNEEMVGRYDIDRYYEKSHPFIRWIERRRIETLYDLAAPRARDRVLEVGCGAGHVLQRFAHNRRAGLDLSSTMLGRARQRLGPEVVLTRGSAENLPFADGLFDVVLCTEVLEHTLHPDRVIAELMRVAKRHARVVVSIPNERNIDRAKRVIRSLPVVRSLLRTLAAEGNEWHVHNFDRALLYQTARGLAHVARLRAIPFPGVPLRYAALLTHEAQAAS